jgi:methylmalonyl-CoA/ethylmalonyl-CoA epimerase
MRKGSVRRIDHVAIAVSSLDSALSFYRDTLGIEPTSVLEFPSEGVKIAFLPLGGPDGSQIELLEPLDTHSGIARFLEKRGEGLHHICLEVPDIDRALDELRSDGAAVLDSTPRSTAEGRGVFLHPRGTGGVLLELIQREAPAE